MPLLAEWRVFIVRVIKNLFKNQLKFGIFLSYATIGANLGVSFMFTPYLLSALGSAEYGVYQLIGSLVAYLDVFDVALSTTISKYIAKYRQNDNKDDESKIVILSLLILFLISIVSVIICFVIYVNFENIFSNSLNIEEMKLGKNMLILVTINLAIKFPMCTFGSVMAGYEEFVFPRLMNLVRVVITPILIICCLSLGYRSLSIVVITTILSLLYGFGNIIYVIYKLKVKVRLRGHKISKKFVVEFVRFSYYIILIAIVTQIYWKTGQTILGITQDSNAVAIYSLAITICLAYNQLSTAISSMMLPRVTRMINTGVTDLELTEYFIKISRIQFIVMSLFMIGFYFVGKQFVNIWLGSGFEDVWTISIILIIPLTFTMSQNLGQAIMRAKDKHSFFAISNLAMAILNVVMSFVLSKYLSAIGIAISTAITLCISEILILNIYYTKKMGIDMKKWWICIIKIIPGMIPSIIVGYFFNSIVSKDTLGIFIIKGCVISIAYVIGVFSISANREEKLNIISKLKLNRLLIKLNSK